MNDLDLLHKTFGDDDAVAVDLKQALLFLKQLAEEMPQDMEKAKTGYKTEIDLLEQEKGGRYAMVYAEVESEVDENNKKKYSNDTKRKNETDLRLLNDDEYKRIETELRELKEKQSQCWTDFESKKKQFEACRARIELAKAMIGLRAIEKQEKIQNVNIMFKD